MVIVNIELPRRDSFIKMLNCPLHLLHARLYLPYVLKNYSADHFKNYDFKYEIYIQYTYILHTYLCMHTKIYNIILYIAYRKYA